MTETHSQRSSEDTRVVFDRETGRIVHTHHSVAIPGVKLPADNVLQAAALEMAQKNSDETADKFDVLIVTGEELAPGTRYKVDLQRRCLVSESYEGE